MGWCFARLYDFMTRRSEDAGVRRWRSELLARARGEVIEVGAGTGLNLALYPAEVSRVLATEPDRHMRGRLDLRVRERAEGGLGPPVEVVDAGAERLPWADGSVDTVVATLVLCTVPDPVAGIAEAMRVLRPDGRLIYLEHVAHEDEKRFRWQRRIEPFWKWFAAGCHLTRRTGELIRGAGFEVEDETAAPMPKAPPFIPTIRGVARKPR